MGAVIEGKVPDQFFALSRDEFLKLSEGSEEMNPGFLTSFSPEVEKRVIDKLQGKVMDAVPTDPQFGLRYDEVTVRKVFAVVSFKKGRIVREGG